MIEVKVKRLDARAALPQYMSAGAAGCDVCALLEAPIVLTPMQRFAIPTGLTVEIPEGYEIQVRPRSGLAFKQGLTVVNAPGTIDSDYRGEVKILVVNLGNADVTIQSGDRIAQLVIQEVVQAKFVEATELKSTERSAGGFGSTGIRTPLDSNA